MHEFVCLQSMTQFGGTLNSLSRNLPNPGFDDFSKPVSVFKSKPGSRFSNPVLDSLDEPSNYHGQSEKHVEARVPKGILVLKKGSKCTSKV